METYKAFVGGGGFSESVQIDIDKINLKYKVTARRSAMGMNDEDKGDKITEGKLFEVHKLLYLLYIKNDTKDDDASEYPDDYEAPDELIAELIILPQSVPCILPIEVEAMASCPRCNKNVDAVILKNWSYWTQMDYGNPENNSNTAKAISMLHTLNKLERVNK